MSNRTACALAALVFCLSAAAAAHAQTAQCQAPQVPDLAVKPKKPDLPTPPACLAENKCTPAQVTEWNATATAANAAITSFDQTRRVYAAKLQEYVTQANAYANCEVATLNIAPPPGAAPASPAGTP